MQEKMFHPKRGINLGASMVRLRRLGLHPITND